MFRLNPSLLAIAACLMGSAGSALAQNVLYSTDFTTLGDWTVHIGCSLPYVRWNADATPNHANGPFVSPPASLNFNNGVDYGGHSFSGPYACGRVVSGPIDLSAAAGTPTLRFWASWDVEWGCPGGWDVLSLEVRSVANGQLRYRDACVCDTESTEWRLFEVPLDSAWSRVEIEFEFDAGDSWFNTGEGPYIDDLVVVDELPLFCLGDGSEGPCPCGNESAPGDGAGCLHAGGDAARLRASGTSSLSNDTIVLNGSGMPIQPVLFFQAMDSRPPAPFGDGMLCTRGPFVRLGIEVNSDGSSSYPGTGDLPVSVKGGVHAPGVRHYQARYRVSEGVCSAGEFNMTNALTVVWTP